MTVKVHELAKELKLNSKDIMDKATAMGIDAKSHMSVLTDIDAIAIKNTIQRSKTESETKIVRVAPKKQEDPGQEEPRVTVKAATIAKPVAGNQANRPQARHEERAMAQRPPAGRPVVPREVEKRPKPPIGKPIISKDLEDRAANSAGSDTAQQMPVVNDAPAANPAAGAVPKVPDVSAANPAEASISVPQQETPAQRQEQRGERPLRDGSRPDNRRPQGDRPYGNRNDGNRPQGDRPPRDGSRPDNRRPQGDRPYGNRNDGSRPQGDRPYGNRNDGSRPQADRPYGNRNDGSRPQGDRPYGNRNDGSRPQGDRPYGNRNDGSRPQGDRPYGNRNDGSRPQGDRPYGNRNDGSRPQGDRPYGNRNDGSRPQGDRPYGNRNDGSRPQGDRPYGSRPQGDRPYGNRNDGSRPQGDRPYGNRNDGSRPQGGNRPPRQDNRGDKPESAERALLKPGQQKRTDEKVQKDKAHDKFAKLESGGKKPAKTTYAPRSLEKQAKPKRHQKQPKPAPEPEIIMEELPSGTKIINVPITVAGFCEQVEISTSKVIMALMKLGIMANINQNIDEDMVLILAEELGVSVVIGNVDQKIVEEGLEIFEDQEEDLKPRPPIITVMGHVDHGKTSLLDAIRKTNVTASESGGITQHIGASEVMINGQKIVFLDTPGHEAFTAMRARGAHATDIAVLVVAADDSVKPQTIESISHAKAAGVPIIVAVNKIDKPGANPDRVKQDLTEHGILVEEWGGDTICVPVSAKTGEGIVNLLEMILLQAEVLELKANPGRLAMGTVIEARLDKARGSVATLLVLNGTLVSGMSVVAGTSSGKIRLMTDYKGDTIKKAGPATAVEILGLTDVPEAGDEFNAVKEDRMAREIAENRKIKLREEVLARNASTTLEQLFSQIQEGEIKELNLIIKGDVMGSVGAMVSSLEKLKNENVRVKIIHTGVGTVTESDVMLAGTSGAVIIGFNVRPSTAVSTMADRENVQIRTYRVIYDVIDDVENAMKGMLDPVFKEVVLGEVEIRNTFKVPGVGMVGGAYVTHGKVIRNAEIRLVRDGIVIHEGKISSLKRFKDDAKEVNQGYECGIGIENYNDIKEGDIIECFQMEQIERK